MEKTIKEYCTLHKLKFYCMLGNNFVVAIKSPIMAGMPFWRGKESYKIRKIGIKIHYCEQIVHGDGDISCGRIFDDSVKMAFRGVTIPSFSLSS